MSGPRVTSGEESAQDYETPDTFMKPVIERFGPLSFDLAAHAGNKKHPRYFAPTHFTKIIKQEEKINEELYAGNINLIKFDKKKQLYVYEEKTVNDDPEAYAKDAFAQSWAGLSRNFGSEHPSGIAHLWLNCEFNDIPRWSERCWREAKLGARISLLTPLTTANWFRDNIAGKADVYMLSGRLSFDGKNVFPKDCMLSSYSPEATGRIFLWDWQNNKITNEWNSPK